MAYSVNSFILAILMLTTLNDTIVYNDSIVCREVNYYRLSQEQLMPELKDNKTQSISFNIFPNPSRDKLLLMTEGNDCDAGISIFNTVGQLIKTISISKGNNLTELDVSSWTEGYYIIHYAMGNYISVKPFIKLK